MITIDGSTLEKAYGVDLEHLKAKAIATKSDGNGGTVYTIPLREIVNEIFFVRLESDHASQQGH
jgi:hypothetical protein